MQFIDPDVRLISYSTRHPKHDMQHLLKEVDKMLQLNVDERPLICGVGLGGYWAERIGFLCDIRQVIFNPNLFPYENMEGKIDRPEEYADIATKCVTNFVMMKRLTASGHLKSCIIITRLSGTKSRRTNSRISPRIYSALKRSKPSGKCPRRIR